MAKHKTVRQREAALDARLTGKGICTLDVGDDPVAAPDPMIGQAAMGNMQISKDMLDYYKVKDAEYKPYRDEAIQMALSQARTQAETAKKQNEYADDTRAYELNTFRPLEQKIASQALNYDTPERRETEAAQAMADVGSGVDAQRANIAREVASRGGDINSGNLAAAMARSAVSGGAVQGAAANQARKNVETVGAAKLADAANMGRGIASANATQTTLGLNAGNSAVGNAQVPGNIGAQQVQLNNGTGTAAIGGNSSAGQLMLGQYNAQTNAQAAQGDGGLGALGNVVGQFAGSKAGSTAIAAMFSDKNMKEDRKSVKPKVSLAAMRKLPVDSWKYKKGSPGDDGGKTHVGPMAQDVNKALGEATAPNGTKVDLISLAGHVVNAVKALDKEVRDVKLALADARPRAKAKAA